MPAETIAPPAPTTPAPAPAAPPAPAPAAPPVDTGKHASAHLDKAFDLLGDIAPKPKTPAPKEGTPPVPPKEGEQNGEPTPAPEPGKEPKLRAKSLREAYDNIKAELAKERAKGINKEPMDLKNHPDVVKLTEQLRQAEKRAKDKDEELKYSNFERSDEFKEKYVQPYMDAYTEGQMFVAQLQVEGADGDVREGKHEDFDIVVAAYLRDPKEGIKVMNQLFGEQSPAVLYHAKEVQKLLFAQRKAAEEYRKNGAEREKFQTEKQTQSQQQRRELYEKEKSSMAEKYPQWFKPVEGDEDGNNLLDKGREQADAAFGSGRIRDPQTGEWRQLSEPEMVKLHAQIHNRATAAPRLVHWLKQKDVRIKELETRLREYEKSEPGPGEPRGPAKEAKGSLWDQVDSQLNKLAR